MDVRTFTIGDAQYDLYGLDQRAGAIGAAASAAGATVQARRSAAAAALATWRGPHATTFAAQLGAVLGAGGALERALLQRAAVLAAFPSEPAGSAGLARRIDASYAAASIPARATGGGVAGDPALLRRYADHSAAVAGQAPAVAAEVHLGGVTGTVARARLLTAAEQQAHVAAGTPIDVAAATLVPEVRPLAPDEVRALVGLRPVTEHVDALLAPAAVLAAFASAVAAALEAADTGLLDALAAVPPGGALAQDTAAALAGRLTDPHATGAERETAAGRLRDLADRDPEAVLAALGPDAVDTIVARTEEMAATADGAGHADATLAALAGALGTGLGSADDATVARYATGLGRHTLAELVSRGPFDVRFSEAAFDVLWVPGYRAENPLAEPHASESRMAALRALQAHPELAARRALADPDLFDDLTGGWFPDGGDLAGRILTDAFYDRVLQDLARDADDRASLLESQLATVYAMGHAGSVNRPAGVALATIAGLHFDDLAFVAEHGRGRGAWQDVHREQMVAFYAVVLNSPEATAAAGGGFGRYAVYRFDGAADHPGPGPLAENLASDARELGAIGDVLAEGVQQHADAEHQAGQLWLGAAQAVSGASTGAVVAGTLTGGGAVVMGGLASWLAGLGTQGLRTSPPAVGDAVEMEQQAMMQAALLRVALDHPGFLDSIGPLPHELTEADFLDRVLGGDQTSITAFAALAEDNEFLDDRLTYLLEAAGP